MSISYRPQIGGLDAISLVTINATPNGLTVDSSQVLTLALSSTSTIGALSNTDWNTFNGKQAAGNYITALTGDATASGPGSAALTLATVNSNVGSFGGATSVSAITVNAKGLVTAAASTSIQIAESQVTNLVSDLALKAPLASPALTGIPTAPTASQGNSSTQLATTAYVDTGLATKQATGNYITALTGDITASGPGSAASTLATVNSNTGSFGSSTAIPNFTVNGKGLITAASTSVVIAPAGTLTGTTLASNVVTSSLTAVGTIATGTWAATTLSVDHGGTGQTSYTNGQLLIGNSSGNTLTKATLTAGSNITITNGNGSISIAASSTASPAYTYVSQSSTLNPAVIGNYYLLSGASFTITLPTAASIAGQTVAFQHNGTSLTQVYTFNTTSSQTIGGIASGSYALYTNGESLTLISDGSNWQILNHTSNTNWVDAGVMTIGATTTAPTKTSSPTIDKIYWRREGSDAVIRFNFASSATTGGAAGTGNYLFGLPANMSVSTAALTFYVTVNETIQKLTNLVGNGYAGTSTTGREDCYVSVFDATNVRLSTAASGTDIGSGLAPINGGSAGGSFSGNYRVPIVGWQP